MTEPEIITYLDKIRDIAGEHALHFVFIAKVPFGEDGETVVAHNFDGARSDALGLVEVFRMRQQAKIAKELDAED